MKFYVNDIRGINYMHQKSDRNLPNLAVSNGNPALVRYKLACMCCAIQSKLPRPQSFWNLCNALMAKI